MPPPIHAVVLRKRYSRSTALPAPLAVRRYRGLGR
jgi:hypothetical protein